MDYKALPGASLIQEGVADLASGRESVGSLLVSIAHQKLLSLGIPLKGSRFSDAELRLYKRLAETEGDAAHSKYNALIRELVSFARALECEK